MNTDLDQPLTEYKLRCGDATWVVDCKSDNRKGQGMGGGLEGRVVGVAAVR